MTQFSSCFRHMAVSSIHLLSQCLFSFSTHTIKSWLCPTSKLFASILLQFHFAVIYRWQPPQSYQMWLLGRHPPIPHLPPLTPASSLLTQTPWHGENWPENQDPTMLQTQLWTLEDFLCKNPPRWSPKMHSFISFILDHPCATADYEYIQGGWGHGKLGRVTWNILKWSSWSQVLITGI